MRQNQKVTLTIGSIVDDRGFPAHLDGIPTWESSDESIATVTPAADGMSAEVDTNETEGSFVITATGDGRQGDDVLNVVGTYAGAVASGDAITFQLVAGTPEDKTPVEPTPETPVEPAPPVETPVTPTEPVPPAEPTA